MSGAGLTHWLVEWPSSLVKRLLVEVEEDLHTITKLLGGTIVTLLRILPLSRSLSIGRSVRVREILWRGRMNLALGPGDRRRIVVWGVAANGRHRGRLATGRRDRRLFGLGRRLVAGHGLDLGLSASSTMKHDRLTSSSGGICFSCLSRMSSSLRAW